MTKCFCYDEIKITAHHNLRKGGIMKILINLIAWWLFFCLVGSISAAQKNLAVDDLPQLNDLAADIDSIEVAFSYNNHPLFYVTHVFANDSLYADLVKGKNSRSKWIFAQDVIADFWHDRIRAEWLYVLEFAFIKIAIWNDKKANGHISIPPMSKEIAIDKLIAGMNQYNHYFKEVVIIVYFHEQP